MKMPIRYDFFLLIWIAFTISFHSLNICISCRFLCILMVNHFLSTSPYCTIKIFMGGGGGGGVVVDGMIGNSERWLKWGGGYH